MRTALAACWVVLALAAACGPPPARVSLADARLAEGPVLVRGPDGHVLRYRFPQPAEGPGGFAASAFVRRAPDTTYYYFAGALQSTVLERGRLVERRLADDGVEEQARRGRVFWLDPDGTTHAIPVLEAP